MKLKYSFLLKFIFIFISGIWFYTPQILATEDKEIKSYSVLEKCNNNWENLTKSLTKDVADYGNRIIQSSRIYPNLDNFLPTYIVTASIPDTQSLPLNNFASEDFYMSENQETKQLFFTTLERQYSSNNRIIEAQNFHWLIFTFTPQGWQLVKAITRFGYPQPEGDFSVSPPRDTTNGIIGQAVNLWLRDCQH
ncbi:hypothetical protein VKI21_01815 [Cyanobacterium aponinum UTEX 3222]|nr:hypothetical protein [Cyanobacterium aponinum]WRL42445.1 hypothetical protein VKI21_01815 [Cyanobacterium aponinum UTEX 3222]MBD2392780.1 hypothetical protein [Cyanobacterium aponinum FACHB-4101]PHV63321.1 hypothetical protein CSQ80_06175 [Cyanobacterium aponinum IPPAS B-1201]WPF88653.1 hypothetical protein SAY89_17985 [Cyanobacterium aponinum AL20115]WRL39663.1 hypothetical protein VKI22_06145 [Cyanobacterium aponinum UTEX 3221]